MKPGSDAVNEVLAGLMKLMAVDGVTGSEGRIAEVIREELLQIGIPKQQIYQDHAHHKSPFGGECGNLIVNVPGDQDAGRRMLSAHMDTVSVHLGSRPKIMGDRIISTSEAGVGTDNRAGVAVVLHAVREILRHGYSHPPLTLVFTVQEEAGGHGAEFAELDHFGRPTYCFDWDGQPPNRITIANTSRTMFEITLTGKKGKVWGDAYNIPLLQARAINRLYEEGWLGNVNKAGREGLSYIGMVEAPVRPFHFETNVSIERMVMRGDARDSKGAGLDQEIAEAFFAAFQRAAEEQADSANRCAVETRIVSAGPRRCAIEKTAPVVEEARRALQFFGVEPWFNQAGNDAGRYRERGLAAIQLGTGGVDAHGPDNYLSIPDFLLACDVGLWLAVCGQLDRSCFLTAGVGGVTGSGSKT